MGLYDAPSLSLLKVSQFKGLDHSVPQDQMQPYRAVYAENMMPDASGEVRKRPGVVYERALGLELFGGETVVEVLDGKHLITEQGGCYTLCRLGTDGAYQRIVKVDRRPLAKKYGDEWLVFLRNVEGSKGTGAGLFNGTAFKAMIAVLGPEDGAALYTNAGMRYTLTEGAWLGERIPHDDPRLVTPEVVKGGKAAGGASPFQEINLLNPWVTESFCVEFEANSIFYLLDPVSTVTDEEAVFTTAELEAHFAAEVLIGVEVEDPAQGTGVRYEWAERKVMENDAFRPAFNRLFLSPENNKALLAKAVEGIDGNGFITKSPKEGEDNVRIHHLRAGFSDGFCRICEAACGTVYGVGGHKDRLFLGGSCTGDADYGTRVYYSELEDPFFIGEYNYIKLDSGADVRAMDGSGDSLAVITGKGIYLAQVTAQDTTTGLYGDDALVTTSAAIPAPAPMGYGNTAVLGGEVVYLSDRGVVAVGYDRKYDARYAEYRSSLIERTLLNDQPKEILAVGRYLVIRCAGGVCWLLDENQPSKEGSRPYASHQYEGFRLTGMTMDAAWVEGDVLRLVYGGNLCRWTLNGVEVYHDNYTDDVKNETAISAVWETPYLYCGDFKRKKIFMRLGVLMGEVKDADTAVQVEGKKNAEDWKVLWGYDGNLCRFNYANLDYRLFTYAGKPGIPITSRKIKVKKAQRFKLRFSNDIIDQPLILREFSLDYVQED